MHKFRANVILFVFCYYFWFFFFLSYFPFGGSPRVFPVVVQLSSESFSFRSIWFGRSWSTHLRIIVNTRQLKSKIIVISSKTWNNIANRFWNATIKCRLTNNIARALAGSILSFNKKFYCENHKCHNTMLFSLDRRYFISTFRRFGRITEEKSIHIPHIVV